MTKSCLAYFLKTEYNSNFLNIPLNFLGGFTGSPASGQTTHRSSTRLWKKKCILILHYYRFDPNFGNELSVSNMKVCHMYYQVFSNSIGLMRKKYTYILTQRASKRDHLRDMKIANFQNLFRGSWGCWENPLRPKNFGPGRTGRPVRPILSAIFGYFSNFERQKNPIKCSVLTTFLHLGGQLGQLGSHKSKIGLGTATQLE